MSVKASSFVAAAALAALSTVASANILANGGFELGTGANAANWQELQVAPQRVVGPGARTGDAFMQYNTPLVSASVLLQNSVADGGGPDLTAGPGYILSFWAKGTIGTTGNLNFSMRYLNSNGNIQAGGNAQGIIFPNQISATEYRQFGVTGGAFLASSNAVFVEIVGANGGEGGNVSVSIDDVSVVAIPEPAAMGLLAPAGLLLARRRR